MSSHSRKSVQPSLRVTDSTYLELVFALVVALPAAGHDEAAARTENECVVSE